MATIGKYCILAALAVAVPAASNAACGSLENASHNSDSATYCAQQLRVYAAPARCAFSALDGRDACIGRNPAAGPYTLHRVSKAGMPRWGHINEGGVSYIRHRSGLPEGVAKFFSAGCQDSQRADYMAHYAIHQSLVEDKFQESVPKEAVLKGYSMENCTEVFEGKDGPGGFTWQESEAGGLEVLFPGKYAVKFREVMVLRPFRGQERLDWGGWDSSARQRWTLDKNPKQLPGKALVIARWKTSIFRNSEYLCWKILKASEHNE